MQVFYNIPRSKEAPGSPKHELSWYGWNLLVALLQQFAEQLSWNIFCWSVYESNSICSIMLNKQIFTNRNKNIFCFLPASFSIWSTNLVLEWSALFVLEKKKIRYLQITSARGQGSFLFLLFMYFVHIYKFYIF